MAVFEDQDISGLRVSGVTVDDATFQRVRLRGSVVRGARIDRAQWHGVEICDVVIDGELKNVIVNGVDIAPLIDAELNRRSPERVKMRPTDADGVREAWAIVTRRWDETIARARTMPDAALHTQVDGEWSFIQTLRHLGFATAAWVGRMILGDPSPWHPLDLPWDEAPGWDGVPWDRDAEPSLEEVLTLRLERQAMVARFLDELGEAQLASSVSRLQPGWPQAEDFPVRECLLIVLNEEWEHRNFAERDLDRLVDSRAV